MAFGQDFLLMLLLQGWWNGYGKIEGEGVGKRGVGKGVVGVVGRERGGEESNWGQSNLGRI